MQTSFWSVSDHIRFTPSEAGGTGWVGPRRKARDRTTRLVCQGAYRRQIIGLFPVAVRVASLRLLGADDTILRGASYADMLSLFSRRVGAVPSTRAPTWSPRTKDAGTDLRGMCAAAPSRIASALIANMAHIQYRRSPALSLRALILGALCFRRPQQVTKPRVRADLRRARHRDRRLRPLQSERRHVRPRGSAILSTRRSRSSSGRRQRLLDARNWSSRCRCRSLSSRTSWRPWPRATPTASSATPTTG